jgi:hypothetical protein
MPGFASGFHEGSRSEYLAQYVFSGFGTASAIPHQEDHGFDLYCTLAQSEGPAAWADKPYTVQVKSGRERWTFKNQRSVAWFIKHPLPMFLCVVDKHKLHFQIYQSTPKYYFWASCQPYPDRLELRPDRKARKGECNHWQSGQTASLSAPILDFTLGELVEEQFFQTAREVLDSWLELEYENLFRVTAHIRQWAAPEFYHTNEPLRRSWSSIHPAETGPPQAYQDDTRPPGMVYQSGHGIGEPEFRKGLQRLRHVFAWIIDQSRTLKDWRGAVRAALLLRHFFPSEGGDGSPSYVSGFCPQLDRFLDVKNSQYVYATLDEIASRIDERIPLSPSKGMAVSQP